MGCKTQERTRAGAATELRRSLERLKVSSFDLFQLHAVTSLAELDAATQAGGALEAVRAARADSLYWHYGARRAGPGGGGRSAAAF